ncbi:hypothetical protein PO124_02405 [Bacillus licheniformis]|nr:hypothetical protein [Bacillus licheniformis]
MAKRAFDFHGSMGAPNEDAVVGHRTDGSNLDEPESSSIREETERMKRASIRFSIWPDCGRSNRISV